MSEIRIVGTAHVSAQSVEDVKNAIEEFQPNIVAIELDPGRFHALKKDAREPTVAGIGIDIGVSIYNIAKIINMYNT